MKRSLIVASLTLSASLLASSPAMAAHAGGTLGFSGMIVEPPCEFDVAAVGQAPPSLRPACPRPAAGNVEFVDAATLQPIKAVSFTQSTISIDLPRRQSGRHSPMIAVVTYK